MTEPHAHFPDYAYYHRRQHPKQLTCRQCGKPIYCVNEHLTWLESLLAIPVVIAFVCQSRVAFGICIAAALLLDEPVKRLIFPHLHFEIDNEAMRSGLKRRRF